MTLFGISVVITVAAVLVAVATWLIHANRLDLVKAETQALVNTSDQFRRESEAARRDAELAEAREHEARAELLKARETLESANQERNEARALLDAVTAATSQPTSLPRATLIDVFGLDPVFRLSVDVTSGSRAEGLDRATVERLVTDVCRGKRFQLGSVPTPALTISISAVRSGNLVTMSVLTSVDFPVRLPPAPDGTDRFDVVSIWSSHSVGTGPREDVKELLISVVDDLLDGLSRELSPANPG